MKLVIVEYNNNVATEWSQEGPLCELCQMAGKLGFTKSGLYKSTTEKERRLLFDNRHWEEDSKLNKTVYCWIE